MAAISPSHLLGALAAWSADPAPRIAVIGDFMLDRTIYGDAERLSPDAPVPVLAVERETEQPGGAAHLARDLAALRATVRCFGLVGADDPGERLRAALHAEGCDTSGLIAGNGPTTVKDNFVGLAQDRHPQKMFRADREGRGAIDPATSEALLARAADAVAEADVVCLEDYAKGALANGVAAALIERARAAGVPVLVDPAAVADFRAYRGASCLTPNRTEAGRATGERDPERAGRRLREDLGIETVVVTLDRDGALLLAPGAEPERVPTEARSVYDVTGAGDMVLAGLAAGRAHGMGWREAVALANFAAGLEVERFGAVPIPLAELRAALARQGDPARGKHRRVADLLPEIAACREAGQRIVFTNGCFDMLHAGHVQLLQRAREAGDMLIVGINSDASIRGLKGPERPVQPEADRIAVLSALEPVDRVVVFEEATPRQLIERIRPDVLVKGADYRKAEVVGADVVESQGGEIRLLDLLAGRSTSGTIERLRQRGRETAGDRV